VDHDITIKIKPSKQTEKIRKLSTLRQFLMQFFKSERKHG